MLIFSPSSNLATILPPKLRGSPWVCEWKPLSFAISYFLTSSVRSEKISYSVYAHLRFDSSGLTLLCFEKSHKRLHRTKKQHTCRIYHYANQADFTRNRGIEDQYCPRQGNPHSINNRSNYHIFHNFHNCCHHLC